MTFLFGLTIGIIHGAVFCLISVLLDLRLSRRSLSFSQQINKFTPKAQVMLKEDFETIEETLDRKYDEAN